MSEQVFQSPRSIEEEVKRYQRERFEDYMQMVDRGELPLEIGIAALRDEAAACDWAPSTGLHGE